MKRLKNNSVLSLFVSMLYKLYQENRERVAWGRALATVSYRLRAVQVRNHQWRENIHSLCKWFFLLPSSCDGSKWVWHENPCHACMRTQGATWRASWPCGCFLLKGKSWGEWLSADAQSFQFWKVYRSKAWLSCTFLKGTDSTHNRVCHNYKFVQIRCDRRSH